MNPTGITANLSVADQAEARDFYVGFRGLSVEGFNLGWVVNRQSPDGRAVVQLVTRDATSPVDSVISVHVGDEVEAAYEEAQRRGFEIVHRLTTEPWGVRRFLARAPHGNVVNIVSHKDEDANVALSSSGPDKFRTRRMESCPFGKARRLSEHLFDCPTAAG